MSDRDFLDELRQELLSAAGDERRRHARRRRARTGLLALAATIICAATSISFIALQNDEAQAALRVTVVADGLLVEIDDLNATPDAVEAAAQAAGLQLSVTPVPVGLSNVGRFIALTSDQPVTSIERVGVDPVSGSFTGFRIPNGFDGTLDFEIGRAARPGEQWVATSDALAPGEVLECQDLVGATAVDAAEATSKLDLDRRWFSVSSDRGAREIGGDLSDYSSWKVSRVLATGDNEVLFELTESGEAPMFVAPTEPRC